MPEALPSRVDAIRLAGRGARIENDTPVATMLRLAGMLADDTGTVRSQMGFVRDAADRVVIDGHAAAMLTVTCQRCLDALPVQVAKDFRLGLVDDDAQADRLPDGIEPVLSDDGHVSPLAVVEDELILALPIVALHQDCSPPADAAPAPAKVGDSPFAVLKQLKNRQR